MLITLVKSVMIIILIIFYGKYYSIYSENLKTKYCGGGGRRQFGTISSSSLKSFDFSG